MPDRWPDRTLALAGIFQAARLAQQLAREGQADPETLRASLDSILRIDAATTPAVFGGVSGAASGLEILARQLNAGAKPVDFELAHYVLNLMQLAQALERRPDLQETIRRGIGAAAGANQGEDEAEDEGPGVPAALIEHLATLYRETISTLSPRIMINGEPAHLGDARTAATIRAALLAGVRAAVLWRQLGGRRWHLLLARTRIAREARRLQSETA